MVDLCKNLRPHPGSEGLVSQDSMQAGIKNASELTRLCVFENASLPGNIISTALVNAVMSVVVCLREILPSERFHSGVHTLHLVA